MATWKRLTRMGQGAAIDVNLDLVVHMQGFDKQTLLFFAVSDGEKIHSLHVKETPDEIHTAKPY
jgi:hypothetical protein